MLDRRQRPTQPASEPTHDDDPDQRLADAEAALGTLLGEQVQVRQTLIEQQQQRQALMCDDGDLSQVTQLDRGAYQLRLRSEQIEHQLPALQDAVQEAHLAVHEARWRDYRPALVQAEQQLAAAIGALYSALAQVQRAHDEAHRRGFASRLTEFLKPPPGGTAGSVISDFALREFVKFAERAYTDETAAA